MTLTPHLLLCHREEYRKRCKSGLEWHKGIGGRHYHIPFDSKRFLSKFSEEDAEAISTGIVPPGRTYTQDKRFAKVRRLLDGLSEEAKQELLSLFNLREGESDESIPQV